MHKLFFILLFSIQLLCKAQVFNLTQTDYQLSEPNFDAAYIKKHNIKEIKITYQYKPENERIFDKGIIKTLYYNKEGYPEKQIVLFKSPNLQIESLYTWYIYSPQNYIRVIRTYDKSGYNSEYFEHNQDGLLIKYSKVKEQNLNKNPLMFKPGYQEIKWTESYKYEFYGKEKYKRTCLNDINQAYKQQMFILNNANKISNIYSTYIITNTGSDEEFKYNEKGQLIEKNYFSNTGNYFSEKYTIEYENNLPYKEYYFLNNKQAYERFFFYNANGLLESDLKKLPDKSMDIAKYEYVYY